MKLVPFQKDKSLVWNETIPHPMCPSHRADERMTACNRAESKKSAKYQSLLENYFFAPIAIDAFVAYGKQAEKTLVAVGAYLAARSGDAKSCMYFRQRLSVALHTGNTVRFEFALFLKKQNYKHLLSFHVYVYALLNCLMYIIRKIKK